MKIKGCKRKPVKLDNLITDSNSKVGFQLLVNGLAIKLIVFMIRNLLIPDLKFNGENWHWLPLTSKFWVDTRRSGQNHNRCNSRLVSLDKLVISKIQRQRIVFIRVLLQTLVYLRMLFCCE